MKKTAVLCLLFAVLIVSNASGQNNNTVLFSQSEFTMNVPAGWQTVQLNHKYPIVIDSASNSNITFIDLDFSGSTSDYIEALFGQLSLVYSNIMVIQRGNAQTNSGLTGEYIIIQIQTNNTTIYQKAYIFKINKGNSVMQIVLSTDIPNSDKFAPLFDDCVKTFNWLR
jgi:hypothetical protein